MKIRSNDGIAYITNKISALLSADLTKSPYIKLKDDKTEKEIHYKHILIHALLICNELYIKNDKNNEELDVPIEEFYKQLKENSNEKH